MKNQIQEIAIPRVSNYGAYELKNYIGTATYKAFATAITFSILAVITLYGLMQIQNVPQIDTEYAHSTGITTIDLKKPLPPVIEIKVPDEVSSGNTKGIESGTKEVAGNYKPVEASLVDKNQIIASIGNTGNVSSHIGNGNTINDLKPNLNTLTPISTDGTDDAMPSPDDMQILEKDPVVNLTELQKSVIYPELARRANVSGSVIVRVLIDENGNVISTRIDYSDNILLDDAAVVAIKNLTNIIPAVQNGRNVKCWVSIPVKFKLR